ncbi:carbon-nitrogen hydrolase family protein [Nocardia sp. IFM 10818]
MQTLTVAAAQTSSVLGDIGRNVRAALEWAAKAAADGAEIVVFPELSLVGYELTQLDDPSLWVTFEDPRLDPLRETPITTVVGAAVRTAEGKKLLASLVFHPGGRITVYGKRYLHGAENRCFEPGDEVGLVALGGWRVALAICYDAGVPGHAQEAAAAGAHVYLASSLYTMAEVRRIDLHLGARAMDHRMYAVAANHAGSGPGWESCGGSGVWHPDGRRLIEAGREPELVLHTLSRAELKVLRERDAQLGYPRPD